MLVTQYNPAYPDMKRQVRQNWNIIKNCEEIGKVFKEFPLVCFRKLPNLRNILTSSTISYPHQTVKVLKRLSFPVALDWGNVLIVQESKRSRASPAFTPRKPTSADPYHPKYISLVSRQTSYTWSHAKNVDSSILAKENAQ